MKQLLCFGDSNTWGLIPKSNSRYSQSVRWTGLLQQKLWRSGVHVREEGLCGRTTVFDDVDRQNLNGLRALTELLESADPLDAAVLMLGTNDCKTAFHASPEEIGRGLEQCLVRFETLVPPERILVISPLLLGQDVWKPEKDPAFSRESVKTCIALKEVYANIAKKRGNAFLAASDHADACHVDEEHRNAEGHERLAAAVLNQLISSGILDA